MKHETALSFSINAKAAFAALATAVRALNQSISKSFGPALKHWSEHRRILCRDARMARRNRGKRRQQRRMR